VFKGIKMTRDEAIKRLEIMVREIDELKAALQDGLQEARGKNSTEAFLQKCGGWEDTRTPDEIVAEIYETRTISNRGEEMFNGTSS
jgi:hypothetical protein